MSEAKQSDSTDLLGQFLEAAKEAGVTRLIPTHPDDIRAALNSKDAEIQRLHTELLALQKDRDTWVRRADKTWHEAHAVAAERERCARLCRSLSLSAEVQSGEEAANWLRDAADHIAGLRA